MEKQDPSKEGSSPSGNRGRARGRAQGFRGLLRFEPPQQGQGQGPSSPRSPVTPTSGLLPPFQGLGLGQPRTGTASPPVTPTSTQPPVSAWGKGPPKPSPAVTPTSVPPSLPSWGRARPTSASPSVTPTSAHPPSLPAWGPPRPQTAPSPVTPTSAPPVQAWGPPRSQQAPLPTAMQAVAVSTGQPSKQVAAPVAQPPTQVAPVVQPPTQIAAPVAPAIQIQRTEPAAPPSTQEQRTEQVTSETSESEKQAGDNFRSRPAHLNDKKGTSGNPVPLVANYYAVTTKDAEGFILYQYHVSFEPNIEVVRARNIALRNWAANHPRYKFGYIFDGGNAAYSTTQLPGPVAFRHMDPKEQYETTTINIKCVGKVPPSSQTYVMFYNRFINTIMKKLQLKNIRRNHYDSTMSIKIPTYGLELWPGLFQAIDQHENALLLCVDTAFKVLRTDSVLAVMNRIRQNCLDRNGSPADILNAWKSELVGTIVMSCDSATFRVDDIDPNLHPTDTFSKNGVQISYKQHFLKKYAQEITVDDQPMLISYPTKWQIRRNRNSNVCLVPELCRSTGLTDSMRSNFQLMKSINEHMHAPPSGRVSMIENFMGRLQTSIEIKTYREEWGLGISKDMVKVMGRVLPPEKLGFANNQGFAADENGDFTPAFRQKAMMTSVALKEWVMIVPRRDMANLDSFIATLKRVSTPLQFQVADPRERKGIDGRNTRDFTHAVQEVMAKYGGRLGMIFIVLPNNRLDNYAAVKRSCYHEYGIQSQCFLAKNLTNRGLMSIATKVAIQMNAKLGGEPWGVQNPLKDVMFVGFDVYHSAARDSPSVGAMTATMNKNCSRYYSTTANHATSQELSDSIFSAMMRCILAYKRANGEVPGRIIFYRDGVGEGQLSKVYHQEVVPLKDGLRKLYEEEKKPEVKFTFVVVTKRINTRIFLHKGGKAYDNPKPGTIVDDVITRPERYDFFLISQVARQGTVSPTHYNVLYDFQGLPPDRLQLLTYKLCYGYFNWSGTVSVPAPCQYAHKLAYLSGLAVKSTIHDDLSKYLYYL